MIKAARQLHLYLGLFFAPSIIFFAFTGCLQTFSFHENKNPGDHHPQWIATLASIHKDQVLPVKKQAKALAPALAPKQPNEDAAKKEGSREKDGDGHDTHDVEGKAAPAAKGGTGAPAPQRKSPLPLKTFVGFLGIGLITSSLLGIYMAFKYNRDRRIVWGLLIAGAALPLALLFL
jgi:hypothetical protein